jgi:hypothetical protein
MRLARLLVPLLAGATVPVALFVALYLVAGSGAQLLEGTLTLPSRLEFAAAPPPALAFALPGLVPLTLVVLAAMGPAGVRMPALGSLTALLLAVLVFGARDRVYTAVWGALMLLPVLMTIAAVVAALRAWPRRESGRRPLFTALVAAVLGTFVLVQYPFAGPVYFFYVAPLLPLAAAAALSLASPSWIAPTRALYAFGLVFGALLVGRNALFPMAEGRYEPPPSLERLALERGGIRMHPAEKAEYEALVGMLQPLAAESGVTFVTPDAPEVYFLSGLRNPTPVLFDFFDEPEGRAERTMATLEREGVRVVVVNRGPQVSGPPPLDLIMALESRYPRSAAVGRFVVRWR